MATVPGERVLITSTAGSRIIAQAIASEEGGSVILLAADRAELYEARRKYAGLENVMVSPGDRSDIPWGDGRFTLILDEAPDEPTAEMRRVLAPNGKILALKDFPNSA